MSSRISEDRAARLGTAPHSRPFPVYARPVSRSAAPTAVLAAGRSAYGKLTVLRKPRPQDSFPLQGMQYQVAPEQVSFSACVSLRLRANASCGVELVRHATATLLTFLAFETSNAPILCRRIGSRARRPPASRPFARLDGTAKKSPFSDGRVCARQTRMRKSCSCCISEM